LSLAMLESAYGRWRWHLTVTEPAMLAWAPTARITREAVAGDVAALGSRNAPLMFESRAWRFCE